MATVPMEGNVKYLNRWLNCPDEILRQNYRMQDMITSGKLSFWQRLRDQGITGYQARLCYDRWIHANRERIKLVKEPLQLLPYDPTEPDPAS